jgi:YaiO family outer membrane protein
VLRRTAEAALAVGVLVAPLAATAQVSQDRGMTIAEARAAVVRGDNTAAITRLESARAAWPNDPEILRLLGSAYAYAGRYDEAIVTLRAARTLAPDDLDVRAALARAYLWSGDRQQAQRELAAIEARDAANADAAAIRDQLGKAASAATGPRGGIFVNQSVAAVSLDRGPDRTWWTTSLGVFAPLASGTTVSLEAEREDRGIAVDTRLLARIDQQFSSNWRGHLTAAVTPEADFRERWSLGGGVEAEIGRHATLLIDARHADYGDTYVTAVEPGIRFRLPSLRSSATVRMINLWDERGEHRGGWSGRLDTETRGGTALFGGVASYPDTEAGITRQVHAAFAGAAIPVAKDVTLRATGEYERRAGTYTRKGLSLGLQFRF